MQDHDLRNMICNFPYFVEARILPPPFVFSLAEVSCCECGAHYIRMYILSGMRGGRDYGVDEWGGMVFDGEVV
jgi:hypothetical protein